MTYRLGGKGTGCGSLSSGDFTSRAKTCITNLLVIGLLGTLTLLGVPQSAQAGEAGGTETPEQTQTSSQPSPGQAQPDQSTPTQTSGQTPNPQPRQEQGNQAQSQKAQTTTTSGDGECTVAAEPDKWNWTITSEANKTAELGKYIPNWGWIPAGGEVRLPGTFTKNGNTYTVTSIGEQALIYQPGSLVINHLCMPDTVETIKTEAFYNTKIADIHLSSNLKTIGEQAFAYSDIPSITIPSKVETIGNSAFLNNDTHANRLNTLDLSQATSLTSIGAYAFYGSGLTSVAIPGKVKTIGDNAFSHSPNNSSALSTVDFSQATSLTSIGKSAFWNTHLTSVAIPPKVETIGDNAFGSISNLTQLDMSGADSLSSIGTEAFIYGRIQNSITLPPNLKTIADRAFFGNLISRLDLPATSALQTIGNSAFAYNRIMGGANSKDLIFPDNLTNVGQLAFVGNLITSVHSTKPVSIGDHAFDYNNISELFLPSARLSGTSPANTENATIYFAPNKPSITLSELFGETDVAGQKLDHIDINPNNVWSSTGVSYSPTDGKFTVPHGTSSFRFAWDMEMNGRSVFNGYYQVYLNADRIRVRDSYSSYGARWTPYENLMSATDGNGNHLTLDDLDIILTNPQGVVQSNSSPDHSNMSQTLNGEGAWHVQFRYPRGSTSALLIGDANINVTHHLTAKLTGSSSVARTGEMLKPETGKYSVTIYDTDGTTVYPANLSLTSGDLQVQKDDGTVLGEGATAAGTYQVRLSAQGKAHIASQLDVNHVGTKWFDVDYSTNDATFIIVASSYQLPLAGGNPTKVIIGSLLAGASLLGTSIFLTNLFLKRHGGWRNYLAG